MREQLYWARRRQDGSADIWNFAILWGALTAILFITLSFVALVLRDDGPPPGREAIQAAVLTVGAEQRAIDRDDQYLGSAAALGAQEPGLGKYFVTGGRLDKYHIAADDRVLSAEYQSNGGAILLNFLDGNLVNVTCNDEIEECPSAAELYRRAK